MPPSRGLSKVEPSKLQNQMEHWRHFKAGDFGQKWNSSKLIVKEGSDAIAPLLELLNDPTIDAETHWFTIRALGNFPEPDVIAAIAAQIGDESCHSHHTSEQAAELSAFAIETLAAMGSSAIEVLSQLLHNPQRRLLATKALNQVRSSGVITAMISVANDEDAAVRYYAIDALGSFHNPAVTPILLAALDDPSAAVRKASVMALGRRSDLQAQHQLSKKLEPLLWDIDLEVSCQTALALGRLGVQDTLKALKQVLLSAHTPIALRIDTVRALKWYCDRANTDSLDSKESSYQSTPDQTTINAFTILTQALAEFGETLEANNHLQQVNSQDSSQAQVAIVRVLGDLRHNSMVPVATETLINQLQNAPSVIVVQACVMALANLAHPHAFDALLPLLSHPADAVPIHTIAALKRLDPDHSLDRVTTYINQSPEPQADVLNLW
ncbi:MAG: HEAT repeat domain-containing protein [Leptolyngbya sp. SIO3F4]|nr:HEAT repeat domain-containing protein [Leptolyngbya sp. SIO3F4]